MEIKKTGDKKSTGSIILERLSRTHISMPLITFFGASFIITTYISLNFHFSAQLILLLYISGVLAFTLVEYVVHRYVFHMKTYNKVRIRLQYLIHGVHHKYPKDKLRLAMPMFASISIASVLFAFFWTAAGWLGMVFGSGFVAGYALYLCVHYSVHAIRPPANFLRILWRNHSIHHYKNHDVAFGVSSPLWDYIFGTLPDKRP